jgi:hypothetical protein
MSWPLLFFSTPSRLSTSSPKRYVNGALALIGTVRIICASYSASVGQSPSGLLVTLLRGIRRRSLLKAEGGEPARQSSCAVDIRSSFNGRRKDRAAAALPAPMRPMNTAF